MTILATNIACCSNNISQWRASAGRVESVDLRFSRQVVVNPEHDAALRPVRATRKP